ncbi:YceI family protein [uncultured Eudoraea sp.]|uniref:YceI family protein n=1 Tax=uncultured Eudoraea sp. TaxID=1035614 RepID=UPI002620D99D|nr:YceI family protein [uncultured Eudoraea sp.]
MKYPVKLVLLFLAIFQLVQAQQSISSARVEFIFLSKDVDGTIEGFQSTSKIDPDDLSSSVLAGSVEVSTIKTGNFLRDWHLKSSKYFDDEEYPLITFKSEEISPTEKGIKVVGIIKIKGISKTLTWQFDKDGNTLRGAASLYCSDFNINIKKRREDNKVEINLILELK